MAAGVHSGSLFAGTAPKTTGLFGFMTGAGGLQQPIAPKSNIGELSFEQMQGKSNLLLTPAMPQHVQPATLGAMSND